MIIKSKHHLKLIDCRKNKLRRQRILEKPIQAEDLDDGRNNKLFTILNKIGEEE